MVPTTVSFPFAVAAAVVVVAVVDDVDELLLEFVVDVSVVVCGAVVLVVISEGALADAIGFVPSVELIGRPGSVTFAGRIGMLVAIDVGRVASANT